MSRRQLLRECGTRQAQSDTLLTFISIALYDLLERCEKLLVRWTP